MGVSRVWADSKKQILIISYEDRTARPEDIVDALTRGGYEPSGEPRFVSPPVAAASPPVPPAEVKKAEFMIVGKMTIEELFAGFPVFAQTAEHYHPEARITTKLKRVRGRHEILLFLGTWCSDSAVEAPKIIKALQTAGNPQLSLTIIGVDKAKREWSGIAERYVIERVPTTVVVKHGREIGRIVEYPKESAEGDLLQLVTQGSAAKHRGFKKRGRLGGGP